MKKSVLIILALFCAVALSAQKTHRSNITGNESTQKSAVVSITEPLEKFSVSPPVIYTSETEFLEALGASRCLEDFNDDLFMPFAFVKDDTTITKNPFIYTIETSDPGESLFAGYNCMSYELLEDTLLITNKGRHINAFGGYFFATDIDNTEFIASPISIIVGDYTYNYTAPDSVVFIGFIFQDTIPYIKFKGENEKYTFATIDHFFVGDNLNFSPEIVSTVPATTDEDTPFSLSESDVVVKDVDGDTQFSLSVLNGENYTHNGNTVTPAENYNGSLQIGVTVTDGSAVSATAYITVTVNPVNDAPVISSAAPTDAKENTQYIYTVSATDPDNASLTYSLSGQPAGMEVNNNVVTWTPATGVTTSGEVTLTVSDGSLTDTEKFTITVTPLTDINTQPELSLSLRPNPASSEVTVVSPSRITQVQVLNVTGKVIFTKNADSNTITIEEVAELPRGIYFVRVKNAKETRVLKLIKQ